MNKFYAVIALLALCSGCATVPAPETVSRLCQRSDSELQLAGYSTERIHQMKVAARCYDSPSGYEVASRTVRANPYQASIDARFQGRSGPYGTTMRVTETRTRDGAEWQGALRKEYKWLSITFSNKVYVGR